VMRSLHERNEVKAIEILFIFQLLI